ncbi:transposase [Verrucosispora sp. WMMC514]|uniref:transposase n=1 Tax=Verrucosispora sp. WMMC514 TaxID=3015156 RepID=UPI00248BF31C|nr:transposase [Verrucosispora sp. WMMC514]WBB89962.1 transposase [Verrucosispora sp. WMMC514]
MFEDVLIRIGARFARSEPRRTVRELLLGLLSPVERKNGWWLAEQAGHASPDRMQRLLRTAVWETDAVAADLRGFVVEHLGDRDGILVADETGYLKKGLHSVGCSGSTPAPPAGSRTRRSGCSWRTCPRLDGR